MEEANRFLAGLDRKAVKKILYNIDLAEQMNDPKLFKKLQSDIYGNSGQSLQDFKYAYLHSGINQQKRKP